VRSCQVVLVEKGLLGGLWQFMFTARACRAALRVVVVRWPCAVPPCLLLQQIRQSCCSQPCVDFGNTYACTATDGHMFHVPAGCMAWSLS
jgi:hypothetical protein